MTDAMLRTAREAVPAADFEEWTSQDSSAAIEGAADGILSEKPLLKLVAKASAQGASAIIMGCFDDTALEGVRKISHCPVIGIGIGIGRIASGSDRGGRFWVITTLKVSVPILEANIGAYGLSGQLGQVRASGVPVLALDQDATETTEQMLAEMQKAAREQSNQSIVPGCGGMVDIKRRSYRFLAIRIIDGVRAAAAFASRL